HAAVEARLLAAGIASLGGTGHHLVAHGADLGEVVGGDAHRLALPEHGEPDLHAAQREVVGHGVHALGRGVDALARRLVASPRCAAVVDELRDRHLRIDLAGTAAARDVLAGADAAVLAGIHQQ